MVPFPALELGAGMTLVFRALDPSSGANVADVNVTEISIYAEGGDDAGEPGEDVLPVYFYGPGGV